MRKKWLASLLTLAMLSSLVPTAAFAAEPENGVDTVLEAVDASELGLPDNDELLEGFLYQGMYGGISLFGTTAYERLATSTEKAIYDTLKKEIEDIAAGRKSDTKLAVSQDDFGKTMTWETLTGYLKNVTSALSLDCPYDLYWFDKTTEDGNPGGWKYGASTSGNYVISATVSFYVAQAYQSASVTGDDKYFTVDTGKTSAAAATQSKAQAIVNKYTSKSDYEKLLAYKNEICDLVSYNTSAAEDNNTPYGDPWQIIYVFDGDPGTNVVCEGYAKAFQYLCDLSTFDDAVCYTVSGQMSGGTGAGGHMWNIVRTGAESYLVDVTNCDGNSVGNPDKLFMKAPTSGNAEAGYQFVFDSLNRIAYAYDSDIISLYGSSILTLSNEDYSYTPPATLQKLTAVASPSTVTVPAAGKTETVTLTATAEYNNGTNSDVEADWSLDQTYTGVELSGNVLTILPSAQVGAVKVNAAYSGKNASVTITLNKAAAKATSIEISGPDTIVIPASGSSTGDYTATVYDQYGVEMAGAAVTWSVSGSASVSVSGGTVTVPAGTTAGTVTLTAKCGTASENITVNITNKPNAGVSITGAPTEKTYGDRNFALFANKTASGNGTWSWSSNNEDVLAVSSNSSNATVTVVGVGKATITATYEDATYYGSASAEITVNAASLNGAKVTVSGVNSTYTGTEQTPSVSVTLGGKLLTVDADYTVTYVPETVKDAGNYTVTVTGKGNYTGTATANFTIGKATPDIGTVSVSSPESIFTSTEPEEVILSRTNITVPGTLKLAENTKFTSGTKSYTWVFTPDDLNYNTLQGTIQLTVSTKALESIAVTTNPTKTTYQYGQDFDSTGMVVTATYDDGSTKEVDNSKLTVSYLNGTAFAVGDTSVTLSYTEDSVTKTCDVTGLSVSKATISMTTASAETRYGTTGTVALVDSDGTATITVTSGSDILDGTPALKDGVLTFAFKDNKDNVGKTATIQVKVKNATNYNDYTITVTVTVVDKFLPELSVSDIIVTYTGKPVPASSIQGTATYEGQTVAGTWSWTGGNAYTNAGSYELSVTFTPSDTDTYASNTATVKVTINKATPTGAPKYTAINNSGKTLADANLTTEESTFSVPGTVAWNDPLTTEVKANTSYQWTFIPEDTDNYTTLTGSLVLYRVSSGGGSSSGSGNVSAPSTSGGTTTVTTDVKPVISGTVATVTVPSSDLDKAVESALETAKDKGTDPAVEIAVDTPSKADTLEVILPTSALEELGSDRDATLIITSGVAEVTLDSDAITAVADQAGSKVTLTVAPVETSDLNSRQRAVVGSAPVLDLSLTSGSKVISSFRGGTATVTIPYDLPNGVAARDLVVWYMDDNGNITPCDTSYNSRTSMLTFQTSHFSLYVVGTKDMNKTLSFVDVDTGSWYYDAVKYTVENGLMSGTSTYSFEPNTTLSRGMIAQMLYALEGKPNVSAANSFADVSVNDWYAKAASWAQSKSIITGYDNGNFGPNDPLTREQLALILFNYAKTKGYNTSAKANLNVYLDGSSTSSWAQAAMSWAVGEGLLSGRGLNMLYPTGTATRAEVAQIMMNFCENVAK